MSRNVLTPEEFYRLPDDGRSYELIDGRLRIRPNTMEISLIGGKAAYRLHDYADQHGGWFFGARLGYRCFADRDRIRKAKATFISYSRVPIETYADEPFCTTAPEVIADVVPRNGVDEGRAEWVDDWLTAGVGAIWLLHLDSRSVEVIRSNRTREFLGFGDTLNEPALLPGFSVSVARLFEQP